VNHGQSGHPVLVGVDPFSTYCYLLVPEKNRDGVTWGVRLLELSERGLHPEYTVADAGKGLRAGQAQAWPTVPCRGDVFHAEREMGKMTTYLENRAYGRIGIREELERKMARARKKSQGQALSIKLARARTDETTLLRLADDLRVLTTWLREDVLSLIGPEAQIRRELFDFIVREIKAREYLAPQRLRPIRVALENQRDELLAFAEELDRQLAGIAHEHQLPLEDVRSDFELGRFAPVDPLYWQKESALWKRLGPLYRQVRTSVDQVLENTVRASSQVFKGQSSRGVFGAWRLADKHCREPQQPAALLLLPPSRGRSGIPGASEVLPEPPALSAQPQGGACRQKPRRDPARQQPP
jgi:hypothetical protein